MRNDWALMLCGALALASCSPGVTEPTRLSHPASFSAEGEDTRSVPGPTADECMVPDPPPGTIPWSNDAPALETYCAAFWVTQGEDDVLSLGFENGSPAKGRWFLQLFIPANAQFVDESGIPVAAGERVRVTLAVHPTLYAVRFGPHGSGFYNGRQAVLKLNYSWADLGKKDAKDLTIYYQPDEGAEWSAEPTIVDKKGNFVSTWLHHFSNYAVAW